MKVNVFRITAVLLILFCLVAGAVNAQFLPGELPVKSGIWDYPIKPGMEEWKELKSHQEMVDVCQIPVNLLSEISTEELAEMCLNYPLFFTMKAFNNLQEGFNQVATEFNGFQELFKRTDAGIVLLAIYRQCAPESIQKIKDLIPQGLQKQRIFFIEFLLSQPVIIEKLSDVEKKYLLSETIVKMEEKTKTGFSTFNKQATSLIAVRVLENKSMPGNKIKDANSEQYKVFSKSILLMDKNMIDEIKNATLEYLKNN